MAFQIYAYYVNHYAVNENNSILAIFGWINWSAWNKKSAWTTVHAF